MTPRQDFRGDSDYLGKTIPIPALFPVFTIRLTFLS
jgi:hypothetical protein